MQALRKCARLAVNSSLPGTACHCPGRSMLSTTAAVLGRRSRDPWDKRFPVRSEDVSPDKPGGSSEMEEALPHDDVHPTGVYHRLTGDYIHVPEMVPEFVVPDLTNFPLKPYVSYRAKEINQGRLTPRDIFNTVYADQARADINAGRITLNEEGHLVKSKGGEGER